MKKNPISELYSLYVDGQIEKYDYIDKAHRFNKTLQYVAERLRNTDVSRIEISDGGLIFCTRRDDIKLCFNGVDRRGVPFDILNFGNYELEDEAVLFKLIQRDAVVLDIGANLGWHSLLFSKRLPEAKIFAFEPIKETFEYLVSNIVINNARSVTALNLGVAETERDSNFYYFPEGSVLASQHNIIDCPKAQSVLCKLTTLDKFVADFGLSRIDFVKCDVEGGELQVVKGGMKAIAKFRPVLMLELLEKWTQQFGYHPNDVIEILATLGYSCFRANGERLERCLVYSEDKTERLNFLFLHSAKHKEAIDVLVE